MFRALCDVNMPKFLSNDLKLFEGILADLFPELKFSPPEYGTLVINETSVESLSSAITVAFE